MMTAKVKVGTRVENKDADGVIQSVNLQFFADYADERNKKWAVATPSISVQMTVKPEVAEKFVMGKAFTLTFEPEEN
jgi:hypothetical protein